MIEGTWKLIGGEKDGHEIPDSDLEQSTLEIADNEHTVKLGDDVLKGTHSLNADHSPMTIDSTDTAGPFAGQSLLGIFKVEDDVFTSALLPLERTGRLSLPRRMARRRFCTNGSGHRS